MKKSILTAGFLMIIGISAKAQYKKDGTPDMRYKENKQSSFDNNYFNNSYQVTPYEKTSKNYDNGGQIIFQEGYKKSNGTFVAPHLKTTPDDKKYNNLNRY
jgi:hypothetical protein